MKKNTVLLFVIAGIAAYVCSSYKEGPAHRSGWDCTGAETACTGTYAGLTGCTSGSGCHNTAATTGIDCSIILDSAGGVPTTHYTGGMTYTVSIVGNNTTGNGNVNFGFQLTSIVGAASAATVAGAGTWAASPLPANTQVTPPYGTYTHMDIVEQSATIPLAGSSTSFTESFVWTAPVTGTGVISFWGAANFVNNNGSADHGDVWNVANATIDEWGTTGIPTVLTSQDVQVYPNPFQDQLHIDVNANVQDLCMVVYDLNGNKILRSDLRSGGNSISTLNLQPGLYFVTINSGAKCLITRTIARQ